jgi:hypothetical protein
MAETGQVNPLATEVATVNGKKRLLVGGRQIQTKAEVRERLGRLAQAIDTDLPALRAGLDAQTVLAREQALIDRRIATFKAVRDDLAAKVDLLDD